MTPAPLDWRALRRPAPENLILDIHSFCNARCRICPYPRLKDRLAMGRMEPRLFHGIIDQFAELIARHGGRGHVIFCNMGEMFLDPGVCAKVEYVLRAGLDLVVQTNGFLLGPARYEALRRTGFDGPIYVSSHGITPEVYREVMGLKPEVGLANLEFLAREHHGLRIRSFWSPQWPRGEGRKLVEHWRSRRPDLKIKVRYPNWRAGQLPELKGPDAMYPGRWLRGCRKGLPFRDMVVSFNGDAVLCCEDMGRQVVLGNVARDGLEAVWNGRRAQEIMDFLHRKAWGGRDGFICRSCEFGLSTPWRRLVKNFWIQGRSAWVARR